MNNENIEKSNIEDANWYVVHTYSGHENKVKSKIENMIENGKSHNIFDVKVPMEEYLENKEGGEKVRKERKIFPGYVLIKMIVDSKNWYLVRNTRGVTGFIGADGVPVPLSPKEIRNFGIETDELIQVKINPEDINISIGDEVEVINGVLKGSFAKVKEINYKKQYVKVEVDMMGSLNLVDINLEDIKY